MHRQRNTRPFAFLTLFGLLVVDAVPAFAQAAPSALPKVTFDEAVRLALDRNPTVAEAATAILRAEALLQQARAATRPNVSAGVTNVLIDGQRGFEGIVAQPRNQALFGVNLSMPVLAASQWAATAQARDQVEIARLSTADVRRQIAVATAQAYLTVISQVRQVEVNQVAYEAAKTHLDYSERRLAAGAGSRLNQLRAAQDVSAVAARLEYVLLTVHRAQEALGVLVAADGPVDANGEPTFDLPAPSALPGLMASSAPWLLDRTDVKLLTASQALAERTLRDSSKDWFPNAAVSFVPQVVAPAGSFSPTGSWSLAFSVSQPIFDSGHRRSLAQLRQASLEASKQALLSVQHEARSEVRLAEQTVQSAERALVSLRLSAQQAAEVLTITTTAFEAGSTTNLEVIDAQRSARDADSFVVIAEDTLRQAKLDLLTALGRFPQP